MLPACPWQPSPHQKVPNIEVSKTQTPTASGAWKAWSKMCIIRERRGHRGCHTNDLNPGGFGRKYKIRVLAGWVPSRGSRGESVPDAPTFWRHQQHFVFLGLSKPHLQSLFPSAHQSLHHLFLSLSFLLLFSSKDTGRCDAEPTLIQDNLIARP